MLAGGPVLNQISQATGIQKRSADTVFLLSNVNADEPITTRSCGPTPIMNSSSDNPENPDADAGADANADANANANADVHANADVQIDAGVQSPAPVSSKPALRRRPRKIWPLGAGCLFLILGIITASQIGSTGPSLEYEEMAVKRDVSPVGAGDDAEKYHGRIVALVSNAKTKTAEHPIDPLLELAEEGYQRIDQSVRDYTATIISQVRISGKLQPEKRIECKIRHARESDTVSTPFSIYLKMLKPAKIKGQEVIWVQGQNEDRLIAHTTGMMNLKRFLLDPRGIIAMKGNRYPIFDIGFKNLIKKMKEFGLRDRQHGECEVAITRDVLVDDRPCTLIEVVHPIKREHFTHHISKIYLDQGRDVLVGYEGFLWPEKPGQPPQLLERYFYVDMQINVGLTDEDFSPDNPHYDFPSW